MNNTHIPKLLYQMYTAITKGKSPYTYQVLNQLGTNHSALHREP